MTMPLAKRGTYSFVGAVLAGCISSTVFAVALNHAESFIFFIVYLTAIPLFVAGLGAGALAGLLASAVGFVDLIVREPSNYAVLYAFLYGIPAFVIALLALQYRTLESEKVRWLPEGNLLIATILYPCVLFLLFCFLASTHEGGLLSFTQDFVNQTSASMQAGLPADAKVQFQAILELLTKFMPALLSASWVILMLASILIAQSAMERHKLNLRPTFSLDNLYVPAWLISAVAITGLLGMFGTQLYSYIGSNLAIILGLPFVFVGIAIVHAWAKTKSMPLLILSAFYIALLTFPLLVLFVALLGMIDQWANFRQRFIKQPKTT